VYIPHPANATSLQNNGVVPVLGAVLCQHKPDEPVDVVAGCAQRWLDGLPHESCTPRQVFTGRVACQPVFVVQSDDNLELLGATAAVLLRTAVIGAKMVQESGASVERPERAKSAAMHAHVCCFPAARVLLDHVLYL